MEYSGLGGTESGFGLFAGSGSVFFLLFLGLFALPDPDSLTYGNQLIRTQPELYASKSIYIAESLKFDSIFFKTGNFVYCTR
jgi:hypothetical protein